ncbi:MAG: YicC/YloC family endoribonuclease [Eubacteriaceae bacterium]|jgi:uncharacterized protein (TIGR00255 family)
MNSMTGYGRADLKNGSREVTVEIRTVNNRYRDIFIKAPHSLNGIEDKIRKATAERLGRGRIEIFIKTSGGIDTNHVICDTELARDYLKALDELKSLDSMISQNVDLELVAKFPDVIRMADETPDYDAIWLELEPVLTRALDQVGNARKTEGIATQADILMHGAALSRDLDKIVALAPEQLEKSTEALKNRINTALQDTGLDENRLLAETAILADRLAIDEETARLSSHLQRLSELCADETEPVGRRLDFLVQEINREINTIGSKTDSIDITNLVVDMKGEAEKIREQVQNIE